MKRVLIYTLGIIGIVSLVVIGCMWALRPGGGGSNQVVPDVVKAGDLAVIQLELFVWGAGGSIKGRYTDVAMIYQLNGDKSVRTIQPKLIARSDDREVYEFLIPPFPAGTSGEVTYYFDVKLDGHYSRINGMKTIKLQN